MVSELLLNDIVINIIIAVLGGFTQVLLWSESFKDIRKYEAFKTISIGAMAGFLYALAIRYYGFPDHIMAFFVGYFGQDFIEGLAEFMKKRIMGQFGSNKPSSYSGSGEIDIDPCELGNNFIMAVKNGDYGEVERLIGFVKRFYIK